MSETDPVPPAGTASGIVNQNSPNHGNQAAGSGNRVHQTVHRAAPSSGPDAAATAETADLIAAIRAVQLSLQQHRAQQPDSVSEQDAEDALDALDKAADEASKPEAKPRVVRRRISNAVEALDEVAAAVSAASCATATATALAGSVAALQDAFRRLFGG